MAFNDLLSKCEAAAKVLVDALNLANVTVNTGDDDDDYALPNVICGATTSGEEAFLGSGNKFVKLHITVNTSANDETLVAHRARVATVFDQFEASDLADQLSNALADFFVQGVRSVTVGRNFKEGGFSDWIECEILACGSDL